MKNVFSKLLIVSIFLVGNQNIQASSFLKPIKRVVDSSVQRVVGFPDNVISRDPDLMKMVPNIDPRRIEEQNRLQSRAFTKQDREWAQEEEEERIKIKGKVCREVNALTINAEDKFSRKTALVRTQRVFSGLNKQ